MESLSFVAAPTALARGPEPQASEVDALAPCPACDAPALELLATRAAAEAFARRARAFHAARLRSRRADELDERASFTQEDAAELLRCERCELVVRWPKPDPQALVRAYAEDRVPQDRLVEMIAAQVAIHRRQVPVLRRLIGPGPRRLVEVGSFVGGFLAVARTVGWSAVGIDPNPRLVEDARGRGFDVRQGTLESTAGELGRDVDAVAIWNTFDQLGDPHPVLAEAAALLRAGGVLALRVPHGLAFRTLHALEARAHGSRRRFLEACLGWNNLLSFPYLHGYGIASLDRVVVPHGFRRVLVRGDVLGPLAGRATRGFARAEERTVKRLQRIWIRIQARRGASALPAAPWLDVYYRREPASRTRASV